MANVTVFPSTALVDSGWVVMMGKTSNCIPWAVAYASATLPAVPQTVICSWLVKALSAIFVTVFGIVIYLSAAFWNAELSISNMPLGIIISNKDIHFSKVLLSILLICFDNLTSRRAEQPRKELEPSSVTVSGISICSRFEQSSNAPHLIVFKP